MMNLRSFLLLNAILPAGDVIMNTSINYWYRFIKKMYQWSREEILEWQNARLNNLVVHFYKNTIYYNRLFNELGLDPVNVRSVNDLAQIPPITKKIIRDHFDELVPQNLSDFSYKKAATGGSTGDPLKYYLDLDSWSYTTASNIYSFELNGLYYGQKYIALGSSSLYPTDKKSVLHNLYYGMRNKIPFNGMNMSDEVIVKYLSFIEKKKIKYIYGYASSIYLLAKYAKTNSIKLKLNACFPTSEILTEEYRQEIKEAFNCIVMDGYGARDGGITADELTPGFYHVGYNSVCEITDKIGPDTGKLLITDLLNYAFPFIRYDLGDEVTMPDQKFDFFNGQVITKVFGRESNIMRLENGHVITGPGFTILFKDLNVIAYRISKTGKMKIKIEIQPKDNFTKDEERLIISSTKKQAGDDCEIEIFIVQKFEEVKSGKRNYFLN